MKSVLFAVTMMLLAVSTTKAATTAFTDEGAFKAAIGLFTVHDFDSFALDEGPDILGNFQTIDRSADSRY